MVLVGERLRQAATRVCPLVPRLAQSRLAKTGEGGGSLEGVRGRDGRTGIAFVKSSLLAASALLASLADAVCCARLASSAATVAGRPRFLGGTARVSTIFCKSKAAGVG